jgi:hypothetical protein
MDKGVSTEGAGEVGAGVQTRLGVGWREAGGSLRFRACTRSGSTSESGSAPALASTSESSIGTAAGRCVEGGGEGVVESSDNACAALTISLQLALETAGSISRSSQMAARREWAIKTGWKSSWSGITQPAAGLAAAAGWIFPTPVT